MCERACSVTVMQVASVMCSSKKAVCLSYQPEGRSHQSVAARLLTLRWEVCRSPFDPLPDAELDPSCTSAVASTALSQPTMFCSFERP